MASPVGGPVGGPLVGHSDDGVGISGSSNTSDGVAGRSTSSFGIFAASGSGVGLRAVSDTGRALEAQAKTNGEGVVGQSEGGPGVLGISNTSDGVVGKSVGAIGVFGTSGTGVGIRAVSEAGRALEAQAKGNGEGVVAQSNGGDGVLGISGTGVGVHGKGGKLAGQFEGNVAITGTCTVVGELHTGNHTCDGNIHTKGNHTVDGDIQLSGQDYAEDFDVAVATAAEPGTVMVLDDCGGIRMSDQAYDRRVAGVVSGAGDYKPAVILGRQGTTANRCTVALMGKVYCRVDASEGPIAIGDLLTTSDTPGHAMKAMDPAQAFGAVIGKALRPLAAGRGLVPILVALQ